MLANGSSITGSAILSIHTGGRIGVLEEPIINPYSFKIIAYGVKIPSTPDTLFLLSADIRDVSQIGVVIDAADELVAVGDVVALEKIRDLKFRLLGMQVQTIDGKKLGKVIDYTLDTQTFEIQQIAVKQGFLRSITDTGSLIHKSQIVSVDDSVITVKSASQHTTEPLSATERGSFVNPFRPPAQSPQVESTSLTSS